MENLDTLTQENKFVDYLKGYHLRVTYRDYEHLSYDSTIRENQIIGIYIDEAFPELKTKLRTIWIYGDVFDVKKSEHISEIKEDRMNRYSLSVEYHKSETAQKLFSNLEDIHSHDSLNVFHCKYKGENAIYFKINTRDEYIRILSKVLSVICI